jgi:hypothetical protein
MATSNLVDRFIEQIKKKKLDGFFLSTENAFLLKDSELMGRWNHLEYRIKDGMLYVQIKAYKQYGYEDEKTFSEDLKSVGIMAETYVGGLSLGPGRYLSSRGFFLLVNAPGLWRMSYPMRSEEEALKAKAFMAKIMPDAKFRVSMSPKAGFVGFLQSISMQEYLGWLRGAPSKVRRAAAATLLCGTLSAVTALTFFTHSRLEWGCWGCVIAFYLCFFEYIRQTYRWNNSRALPRT